MVVAGDEEDVSVATVLQRELVETVRLTVLVPQRPKHFVVERLITTVQLQEKQNKVIKKAIKLGPQDS